MLPPLTNADVLGTFTEPGTLVCSTLSTVMWFTHCTIFVYVFPLLGATLLMPNGRPPSAGEVFRNPDMAGVLRELGTGGKDGFYGGRIGEAMVKVLQEMGGVLTMEDLKVRSEGRNHRPRRCCVFVVGKVGHIGQECVKQCLRTDSAMQGSLSNVLLDRPYLAVLSPSRCPTGTHHPRPPGALLCVCRL